MEGVLGVRRKLEEEEEELHGLGVSAMIKVALMSIRQTLRFF